MKHRKLHIKSGLIFGLVSLITLLAAANQEKVIQIFRQGEVLHEYKVSDIDYIEINDLISAPENINATISGDEITIVWNQVEGATYNVYRSPDNVNFSLIASNLTENSYTDKEPFSGANYYRVKAIVGDMESGYTQTATTTIAGSGLNDGIYLGISSFNQQISDYPILQLTDSSVGGFHTFVNNLTMKNGTLLYYSVDQALNNLEAAELPENITTAAIVTFTDGLDQGSMMKDVPYEDDMEYLDALNQRILTEKVAGKSITAYSIGIKGNDVSDTEMFRNNLQKLASSSKNAMEVSSMSEVNAKFKEIAERLSESNYVQTINLKMPGVSNGTRVRFTFDNVGDANQSELYIEGKFNLKERSLEEVTYHGLESSSGEKIQGTVEDIFVTFTFEDVHTDNNVLIRSEFTDEWTFITSNSSWQINSEFDKTENSDIVTKRSSAVVMLVLDCSSSLAGDFEKAQSNANDFINTLHSAVSESGGKVDDTVYSATPKDLSVAIFKNGTRYYLTPEQYKKANLKDAVVEGLVVLSNLGDFIISQELLYSGYWIYVDNAMKYYSELLPNKVQASIISARYPEINSALYSLGWERFNYYSGDTSMSNMYYLTKTPYNSTSNYCINLRREDGGNLDYSSGGYLRGVVPLEKGGPIQWKDERDLTLAVKKDGKRYYISDPSEDLSAYDEVEGIAVFFHGEKFIIKLQDEQLNTLTIDMAISFYKDQLPTEAQAKIISLNRHQIQSAISKFGGSKLNQYYYLTGAKNTSGKYYTINMMSSSYSDYGSLYTPDSQVYVRGVIPIED